MRTTLHAGIRMSQRGIQGRLVEFALRHGRVEGDKRILDRNESRRLLEELNEELRLVKRVLDKGGITVVADGDAVITTYNIDQRGRATRGARSRFLAH
jgi:hypothetical protein